LRFEQERREETEGLDLLTFFLERGKWGMDCYKDRRGNRRVDLAMALVVAVILCGFFSGCDTRRKSMVKARIADLEYRQGRLETKLQMKEPEIATLEEE
jgi:hypothetical protein